MKKFTRVQLEANNVGELDEQVTNKRFDRVYTPLIRCIAEVCDLAAQGENAWITIGKTKDGTALALSVNLPDGRLSAYGATVGGLSTEAEKLL